MSAQGIADSPPSSQKPVTTRHAGRAGRLHGRRMDRPTRPCAAAPAARAISRNAAERLVARVSRATYLVDPGRPRTRSRQRHVLSLPPGERFRLSHGRRRARGAARARARRRRPSQRAVRARAQSRKGRSSSPTACTANCGSGHIAASTRARSTTASTRAGRCRNAPRISQISREANAPRALVRGADDAVDALLSENDRDGDSPPISPRCA